VVENNKFKNFIHMLDPESQVPCRKNIASKVDELDQEMFDEKKASLQVFKGTLFSLYFYLL
jgi:hypothetical protein